MKPRSRVAAIILGPTRHSDMIAIPASSSTEAEWASVAFGLELALHNNETSIGLENDNLSVIHGLIFTNTKLKQAYANHYRNEIRELANETLWAGVRWIPREINQADKLFHNEPRFPQAS